MCSIYTYRGNVSSMDTKPFVQSINSRGSNPMTNFTIKGIAADTENATVNTTKPGKGPQSDLTMTKMALVGNTAGKLFLALDDVDPNTPNAIGMLFNGNQVAIRKNEKFMSTDTADETEGRTKAYAFDIPMRFIEGPATHTIQFLLGTMQNEQFIEESKSDIYTLTIVE